MKLKKIDFMSLDTAEKQKLIETHQVHPTDTGSSEVQVAMLSKRISKLSDTFKETFMISHRGKGY